MATLLLAEVAGGKLGDVTARALTAALQLGAPVDVLVAGAGVGAAASAAAQLQGVAKVRFADDALYAHGLAEPLAALIVSLAGGYDAIVAPSTASAKNVAPRVAALLDVMQISDVMKVIGAKTFERPIYAGNAIQTVESSDAKIVVTVRTASFAATGAGRPRRRSSPSPRRPIRASLPSSARRSPSPTGRSSPRRASSFPAAGRCRRRRTSRPISSRWPTSSARRWAPRAPRSTRATRRTTGRSGRRARSSRPELYIAVGISGAIQHLAGMKDSKVIVAINKDEEAPIFQVADYGLVADLYTALPELAAELGKIGR